MVALFVTFFQINASFNDYFTKWDRPVGLKPDLNVRIRYCYYNYYYYYYYYYYYHHLHYYIHS